MPTGFPTWTDRPVTRIPNTRPNDLEGIPAEYPTIAGRYPPSRHLLRDLRLSIEFHDTGRAVTRAPVLPEACTEGGSLRVGVIAVLVDVLGGALSGRALSPDWMATSVLALHTAGRIGPGTAVAEGSVIRVGRTGAVIDVEVLHDPAGAGRPRVIGSALVNFSRLPQREGGPILRMNEDLVDRFDFGLEDSRLRRPILEVVGLRVLDEGKGVVELAMTDYVRNSFEALQGGAIGLLADTAGELAARHVTGRQLVTADLTIHYLLPGRVGPFRTRTRILGTTAETASCRVEIVDRGAGDRAVAVAMHRAGPEPAGDPS